MNQPKPTKEQQDQVLVDRPGDEIYSEAKEDIDKVIKNSEFFKKGLVELILKDMSRDLAVSDALNTVALVLNYLPQDKDMEIESPEFSGDKLIGNFARISQLNLSMEYAKLLDMDEQQQEVVLKAEVGRLWGDPNAKLLKRMLMDKKAKAQPQPDFPAYTKKGNQ